MYKNTQQYSWSLILREKVVFCSTCSRVRGLRELAHLIRFQSLLRIYVVYSIYSETKIDKTDVQ